MNPFNEEAETELDKLPVLDAAEVAAKHVFDGLRKKARALHKTPTSFRSQSAKDMREINAGISEYLDLYGKIERIREAKLASESTGDLINQFKQLYESLTIPASATPIVGESNQMLAGVSNDQGSS